MASDEPDEDNDIGLDRFAELMKSHPALFAEVISQMQQNKASESKLKSSPIGNLRQFCDWKESLEQLMDDDIMDDHDIINHDPNDKSTMNNANNNEKHKPSYVPQLRDKRSYGTTTTPRTQGNHLEIQGL